MLAVDPTDSTPPYEQLRRQIIDQVTRGELAVGHRLPAVRRLAADLGLAPNTVARTYRELEVQGYLRTAGRNGTVVAPPLQDDSVTDRQALELTQGYVAAMRALGLSATVITGYLRKALP